MIPKIAARGTSFKGAHLYYGHDKQAETSARVLFFETLNMRSDDPDKAWKIMAQTALREEALKKESGIHWNGQATSKPVYSFSLAWDKDQNPSHEEMKAALLSALKQLKMEDHQAMLYGHGDTDHPHGHGVVNLIHPETGKTAEIWQDQLALSEWSEDYELKHGGIRCEQRVENNKKRQRDEFVKHRDHTIQNAWNQSKTGVEFSALLEEKGYLLAQGKKRLVIVDPYGKAINPARQIAGEDGKNIKAAMLKERLADLDQNRIQSAEAAVKIQAEREYFDRDNYHAQQQEAIEKAAIEREGQLAVEARQDALQWQEIVTHAAKEREKQRIAQKEHAQTRKSRYDYRAEKEQRLKDIDQTKARAAKRMQAKAAMDAKQREQDKIREFKKQDVKENELKQQQRQYKDIRDKGSFADKLDKTREQEAQAEAKAARIEKIFGQQERNIEEGIKRGFIEAPEPEQTPQKEPEQDPSLAEVAKDYEQASAPEPIPEQQQSFSEMAQEFEQTSPPEPEPAQEFNNASETLKQIEQTTTPSNDNAASVQQEQSRDSGGYER